MPSHKASRVWLACNQIVLYVKPLLETHTKSHCLCRVVGMRKYEENVFYMAHKDLCVLAIFEMSHVFTALA